MINSFGIAVEILLSNGIKIPLKLIFAHALLKLAFGLAQQISSLTNESLGSALPPVVSRNFHVHKTMLLARPIALP